MESLILVARERKLMGIQIQIFRLLGSTPQYNETLNKLHSTFNVVKQRVSHSVKESNLSTLGKIIITLRSVISSLYVFN
jgi:hypothetical protein